FCEQETIDKWLYPISPPFHRRDITFVVENDVKHQRKKERTLYLASIAADLGAPLDDYVSRLGKVSVVRATSREGLIRARLLGLRHVTATTVVFLDSHCECAEGWLEPLLSRIAEDPSRVVVPAIIPIDPNTFEYRQGSLKNIYVGKFTWELFFKWSHIQPQERARRNSSVDPVRTPTMAGGLFAIDRNYFYKLGTYDPGMKIWGGENLELSFKIWMCGGTLEMLPCSNVGHVFRAHAVVSSYRHVIAVNLARLAAVWLDDYIVYYHQARPQYRHVEPGDVSARKALRRQLQCHSFAWYMKHVLPEDLLPADTVRPKAIFNEFFKSCIGRRGDQLLVVKNCTKKGRHTWLTGWKMDKEQGFIHNGVSCLHHDRGKLKLQKCQDKGGNQAWNYIQKLKQLYHMNTKSCVELVKDYKLADGLNLMLSACSHDNPRQQWLWDTSPPPGPSWRKDEAAGLTVV
ncbi:polypeptide N-acetylgalactosaminyltransferase 5-like, partial [Littorina saxatilis]|uniref:polypeptide N-acetylgalactosaminyltransferase 5-like n=1 Tax=Littorina saxatilis TaxID=31220 RepID=UPI0038B451A5